MTTAIIFMPHLRTQRRWKLVVLSKTMAALLLGAMMGLASAAQASVTQNTGKDSKIFMTEIVSLLSRK